FWLATSLEHPLSGRSSVSLREVQDASLMLLVDGHCLRDQALAICADPKGSTILANDVRATSLNTLLNLVGAGLGTTIVPSLALDLARAHNVATVPLDDYGASRTVRILHRPSSRRHEALKRLARIVSSHVPPDRVRNCLDDSR
ncbi:MAG: LysR substrate-binding domain-containing protein, partial [Candidatus Eremiobacteraeota bacterium]|nr:LysR substrate-binding domain-containing protein [Candidatus Eremiobacteraeota bacterium]